MDVLIGLPEGEEWSEEKLAKVKEHAKKVAASRTPEQILHNEQLAKKYREEMKKESTIQYLFIPYEEAAELKRLGFNYKCIGYWWNKDYLIKIGNKPRETHHLTFAYNHNAVEGRISSPIYSQAFDWFRKEHGLYSYLMPKYSFPDKHVTGTEWRAYICGGNGMDIGPDGYYQHEEAELACLRQLIKIVKAT